jgi:hypothetical protein
MWIDRDKVLIIGNSHARRMAIKLWHNLQEDYNVQGLVKPGAALEATLGLEVKDIKSFTKNDVLLMWGSTKDFFLFLANLQSTLQIEQ